MHRSRVLLALFAFTLLTAGAGFAEDWPQWRGPNRDGISRETNLPAKWDVAKKLNVAWAAPLPGMGGSTPAVWKDRIFLTTEDANDVALVCLDTDGKQL